MFIQISSKKLRELRGDKSRQQIADLTGGLVKPQDIYSWETDWQPSKRRFRQVVPALAKALNCRIEDITEPIEMSMSV